MHPPRDPQDPGLSERERARLAHRDRKRMTPMVVDGAGIRRILPALQRKKAAPKDTDSGKPG